MKTKKFLIFAIITLFALIGLSTNAYATEVSNIEELQTAIEGTDETITVNSVLTVETTETLDLKGKTVVLNEQLIIKGGNLTVTGNGKISTSKVSRMIDVLEGSTLKLENGTFETTVDLGAAVRIYGTATDNGVKTNVTIGKDAKIVANIPVFISTTGFGVTVNIDGKLQGKPYTYPGYCVYINGSFQETSGNVPVINISETASIISEKGQAVYAAGYGIWNINGGYLEGSEALSIKGGVFNITGGTLKATGAYVEPEANGNGTEPTGSAISITGNKDYAGKVKLNISNATVTSENGYAVYETITNAAQPAVESMKITSGDFSGKEGAVQADNIENFVEGGTFSSEVDDKYLSSTVEAAEENGVVLVGTKNKITVDSATNGKVTASLSEAIKGQTVTLTVTPEEGYQLKSLTVNGVAVTGTTFTMPDEEVTVKAEFEKIPVKAEENKEEKDETPKMGEMNISFVWATLAVIALVGIATTKKVSKHSK